MQDAAMHEVARAITQRRSWRIYTGARLTDEVAACLERSARLAPSVRGRRAARLELLTDPDEVKAMTSAVMGGVVGKWNMWLRSAPPGAWGVLVADSAQGSRAGDRHLYNVDAAVLGELVVLAAVSRRLGSCWLAAIDSQGIARHLGLGPESRVPAVIGLGEAGLRQRGSLLAASWDRVSELALHRRRRRTAEICSLGRFGSGSTVPVADLAKVPSNGRPLDEAIEALSPSSTFAGEAPDRADVGRIVEAMRLAPSADNAQTWRFVVIEGASEVGRILSAAGLKSDIATPPGVVIVALAAPFIVKSVRREQPFALIDHPIALTHGALIAEALGLHWALAFDFDFGAVREAVFAPANHEVTALFALDRGGDKGLQPYPRLVQLHR
jgi:nitroreductase